MKKLLISVLLIGLLAGSAYAETASMALDPMYLGVGARPLGMGKSYVAVAEGADAILLNPAGLGSLNNPVATSMYANLMNDAAYTMIAGGMPVTKSIGLGAGFVAVSVGDIGLYTAGGVPNGKASYSDGVAFISAGINIEKDKFLSSILPGGGKNLQIGITIKLFSKNASGSDLVEAANGSGMNADIGFLLNPAQCISLGGNQQNLLGTKISYKDGVKEDIPALTKLGSKISIIGEKGLFKNDSQKLDMALDLDMNLWGLAGHIGAEYKPLEWLSIRAGVDQDSSPTGISTNPTAGVGFNYAGFAFDYAFHPYGKLSDDATHFFSISYVGEPKKVSKPEPKKELSINVLDPENKSVVYDSNLKVKAEVLNLDPAGKVEINGIAASKDNRTYTADVSLETPGKHLITLKASDGNKKASENIKVLKLVNFKDVKDDNWAKDPIESCATIGLVQGFPDGTFLPEKALSRAELATLLVRARKLPLPTVGVAPFTDVPKSHWAAPYILAAKNEGLVKGYPDGTFRPNQKISRAEGITVFARSDGLKEGADTLDSPYSDVPSNHWAAKLISSAKDAGLLDYIETDTLTPQKDLSRAEAVKILSNTELAKPKIAELRDFEVGFGDIPQAKAPKEESRIAEAKTPENNVKPKTEKPASDDSYGLPEKYKISAF